MGRLRPRQVYGITLTDEFLMKEPSYWDRDSDDEEESGQGEDGEGEEKNDFNAVYWDTAAMFVTERASSAYPCRLEYVDTKSGTMPCVVLADTKSRAAVFKTEHSEQLKNVQAAIGTDRIPHWYWLT